MYIWLSIASVPLYGVKLEHSGRGVAGTTESAPDDALVRIWLHFCEVSGSTNERNSGEPVRTSSA